MTRHLLQALLLAAFAACTGTAAAAGDGADRKPQGLPVLEVSFGEKTMPKQYTDGTMCLTYTDGKKVELNARFKTRGATALQYSMKPSFNMKLRDQDGNELDSTLCGLRRMSSYILDAMAIDRIGMRNRVAFDLWNDFSRLPYETDFGSRNGTVGQFVEVYINNEYKGIYCMTDRVNRKLLNTKKPLVETIFPDGSEPQEQVTIRGVIYKHGTNSIGDQSSRCFSEDSCAYVIRYHDAWELTEPEDYAGAAAWAPLDDVYEHNRDYEWVKEHFFLEQLADYQVFIMALSIVDNWGNKNSYIGARDVTTDGNKHRFVYTPWDLDTSLGGSYNGSYYDGKYSDWKPSQITSASTMPVPFPVCNGKEEYKTLLREAWIKGREGALSLNAVRTRMYEYRNLFLQTGAWEREMAHWQTQKYQPPRVVDLRKEVELILDWYAKRIGEMDRYFDTEDYIYNVYATDTPADDAYYNLQGQRLHTPAAHGIYIHHGKKVSR